MQHGNARQPRQREWDNPQVTQSESPVQEKARVNHDPIHYALLFVSARQRAAAQAFTAFERNVRSVTNEVRDPGVARAKVRWWREEVNRCFDGAPTHPDLKALAAHTEAFGITRMLLLAVVDGADMDLSQFRYFDYPELERYCDLVSGAPTEVLARICGHTQEGTLRYARKLGLALQLAAIVRNVGHDARHSRIYLPADEMDRFQVKESAVLAGMYTDGFNDLMALQVERALSAFDEALALLPAADRGLQKPTLALISIQRRLLQEIVTQKYHVLEQAIDLTPVRKYWLAWKMQALGRL